MELAGEDGRRSFQRHGRSRNVIRRRQPAERAWRYIQPKLPAASEDLQHARGDVQQVRPDGVAQCGLQGVPPRLVHHHLAVCRAVHEQVDVRAVAVLPDCRQGRLLHREGTRPPRTRRSGPALRARISHRDRWGGAWGPWRLKSTGGSRVQGRQVAHRLGRSSRSVISFPGGNALPSDGHARRARASTGGGHACIENSSARIHSTPRTRSPPSPRRGCGTVRLAGAPMEATSDAVARVPNVGDAAQVSQGTVTGTDCGTQERWLGPGARPLDLLPRRGREKR